MNLALPLGLAAGLIAGPILALYILKMRRREVVVGSVLLWGDAVRDLRANAPWQRLRPNPLLALQLAALAALAFALARPYTLHATSVQGDVVVLLDASAAMNATDAPGFATRFAAAQARAATLIDGLAPGDVISLVRVARSPRVVIAQSSDRAALHAALDALRPSAEAPDVLPALSLGAALARGSHAGTLALITGAGTPLPAWQALTALDLRVIRVGGVMRDLALVAFAAGLGPNGGVQAVARVVNYGPRPATTDVELRVDSRLLDVRTHTIPAGGEVNLSWSDLPASARMLQAHLTAHDDLALDDTAWAAVPHSATRHVLLVSAGNVFLATALSLDPTVRLQTIAPAAYGALPAPPAADLTILDGYRPSRPPAGNLLVLDPPPGGYTGFTSAGRVAITAVAELADDPAGLARYLQPADVHVAVARQVTPAAWLRPIVVAGGAPLLLAGESRGQRLAVFTFNLHDSDLPLQPDLPVLISSLLEWLAPGMALPPGLQVRPGDVVAPLALPGVRAVTVDTPAGQRVTLGPPFPSAPFAATDLPGAYTLRQTLADGTVREELFAVDVFPASPNAGLSTADTPRAPGRSPSGSTAPAHPAPGVPVDVSALFAGAALALLCVEWWVAGRAR